MLRRRKKQKEKEREKERKKVRQKIRWVKENKLPKKEVTFRISFCSMNRRHSWSEDGGGGGKGKGKKGGGGKRGGT